MMRGGGLVAKAIKHITAGLLHVEVIGEIPPELPGRYPPGEHRSELQVPELQGSVSRMLGAQC